MGYKVFVSHSTKERNLVFSIRDHLEEAGISVYLAEEDLQPGMNLPQKIIDNIKSANCMVVVLTDKGIRSQFVNQEVGVAKGIDQLVIPMVEEKVKKEIGGLFEGEELIIFNRAKPEQAIKKVSSYVSRLKLSLELKLKQQEEALRIIMAIIFIILFAILIFYALRKK